MLEDSFDSIKCNLDLEIKSSDTSGSEENKQSLDDKINLPIIRSKDIQIGASPAIKDKSIGLKRKSKKSSILRIMETDDNTKSSLIKNSSDILDLEP
jgi:hypothetical protein